MSFDFLIGAFLSSMYQQTTDVFSKLPDFWTELCRGFDIPLSKNPEIVQTLLSHYTSEVTNNSTFSLWPFLSYIVQKFLYSLFTVLCDWKSPRLVLSSKRSKLTLFMMSWQILKVLLYCFLSQVQIDMAWSFQMSYFSSS